MNDWDLDGYAGRAAWRRAVVLGLTLATMSLAGVLACVALDADGLSIPEGIVLGLLVVGVGWLALSFWAAVAGFALAVAGRHHVTLARSGPAWGAPPRLTARTAVLMPIHNEDPGPVMARIAATYRSTLATGRMAAFDFYLLSDTTDAGIAAAERAAWEALRRDAPGIFYRRRAGNAGRKAGNIADWLDASGAGYAHMVVLDADSVMAGDTLVRLAALMEANPRTGIIQTLTATVGGGTLFARALQFAGRLYGPILAAGHGFWQMGEANYYGHNAIIRVAAFAEHCRLPTLSGAPPLGGQILSHDFVEAALMRRGGLHVWLLPELGGSYEEMPSNLLDFAARDRRWIQGNLQHARLLGLPGLHWMSRLQLAMGVLAYVSSPLWLALLLFSAGLAIRQSMLGHAYFGEFRELFPHWPEYRSEEIHLLVGLTGILLYGPKLLGFGLAFATAAAGFGGRAALSLGAACELLFSTLIAPVLMMFHTAFIVAILAGRAVGWPAQTRVDRRVPWPAAISRHRGQVAGGLLAACAIAATAPDFVLWIAPVCLGLILAVPVTVLSSDLGLGWRARAAGLFGIPEEAAPPRELLLVHRDTGAAAARPPPYVDADVAAQPVA